MESKIEYEKIKIQIYVIRQYAYVTYMDVFWKTPLRSAPLWQMASIVAFLITLCAWENMNLLF